MHRRRIVVEGTTYGWCTTSDRRAMVVFPPKGCGGPVRFEVPQDDHSDDDPFWDGSTAITPRMVADNIHAHFLRGVPPARVRPVPTRPDARMEPDWATSAEEPRAHVVTCTLSAAGLPAVAVPLEAHVDASTARGSARDLALAASGVPAHYAALRAWSGAGGTRPRPTYRGGRRDGGRGYPGLEDWLDRCLAAGVPSVDAPAFSVAVAPLVVPVRPVRVDPWGAPRIRDIRAARSLSTLRA